MDAPLLRPLRIGETIDVGIKLYFRHFWLLTKLALIVLIPAELIGQALIFTSTGPDDYHTTFELQPGADGTVQFGTEINASAVLMVILGATFLGAVSFIMLGICGRGALDAYLGRPPQTWPLLRSSARRLHTLLWITFLVFVIVLAGLVACFVPGIWLAVAFSFVIPVALAERTNGFTALGRSRSLVDGRWWHVFSVFSLGTILLLVAYGLAYAAGALLESQVDNRLFEYAVSVVADLVTSGISVPFFGALMAVLYVDLRVRKEGFDVQVLSGAIQGEGGALDYRPLPPGDVFAFRGQLPPYWPPPPGWTPAARPPSPPPPPASDEPPYWPPPPGWQPGSAAEEGGEPS